MATPPSQHVRHHSDPRITANELARYMVASDTGKLGIIRRARESVTASRIRYSDVRKVLRTFLADPGRNRRPLTAAREMFEQRADDASLSSFLRDDALKSVDVIDFFVRMQNQLGGMEFGPAPARQKKLVLSEVEVSVNVDLLTFRTRGNREQVGGAMFRLTKAEDETEAAAAKRRDIGSYAATLVQMQVREHLAGNKEPIHQLCMSIDVQCQDIHFAPRNFATRAQNLENACKFIAGMWDRA